MKRIPKPVFFIVVLLILAFAATSIFGVSYYVGDNKHTVIKGLSDVRWGIDIRGGVEATFKPAGDYNATDSQLDAAKAIVLLFVSHGKILKQNMTQLLLLKKFLQLHCLHSVRVKNLQIP